MSFMEELNQQQLQAVCSVDGPLLILAGAGTGKTKVLISRIVHIIESGLARPDQILATTFTNKAAKSIKERLNFMTNNLQGIWIGTFHSLCVRLLRTHHVAAGLSDNFVIIDADEQSKILNQISKSLELDEKKHPTKLLAFIISGLKDKGINYYETDKISSQKGRGLDVENLYRTYQEQLKSFNLVDFDDIILHLVNLLKNNQVILNEVREMFRYIMVDEYQDTSTIQNNLLRLIASGHQNICCVGDEDQSIYSWRGADVSNILKFGEHFPSPTVIKLEQNYRSTGHILNVAMSVISNNKSRYGKNLRSNGGMGNVVKLIKTYDGAEEANVIARAIKKHMAEFPDESIAILIRASFQTRAIEEGLTKANVPYNIVDGIKFYDRKEIKDIIAYLRVIYSDVDQPALERIINVPKRGVGDKSWSDLIEQSHSKQEPIVTSLRYLVTKNHFGKKSNLALKELLDNLDKWRKLAWDESCTLAQITEMVIENSGYMEMLIMESEADESNKNKVENLKEFVSSLSQFQSMAEFLEHVALFNSKDGNPDQNAALISTIHAAKGLEFDKTFLPGWEEGIFPSGRSVEEGGDAGLEEERRLAYVAITRAKKNLTITHATRRLVYGKWQDCVRSRFIQEIKNDAYGSIDVSDLAPTESHSYQSETFNVKKDNFRDEFEERAAIESQMAKHYFAAGARIEHNSFGLGTVIKSMGHYLEVHFDSTEKRLIHHKFIKKAA